MIKKEKEWLALKDEWNNCSRCPLSKFRTQVVFGEGNINARLMLISEAPGKDEDLQGRPFVGKAGDVLSRLFKSVGIDRKDVWITNTCLCRPKSQKKGKENRQPTVKEIEACNPRLMREVEIVRPEIIVLAGNTPLYLATGKQSGVTKQRGWLPYTWVSKNLEISKIYCTLHPASLLYGGTGQIKEKASWIHQDWTEIAKVLHDREIEKEQVSET